MTLEIVTENKGKQGLVTDLANLTINSFVYFIMGLSFIVAPYAGKKIQAIGSKHIRQNLTKSISAKKSKFNIKNNDILIELLEIIETSSERFHYWQVDLFKPLSSIKKVIEDEKDFNKIDKYVGQYNSARRNHSENFINTPQHQFFVIPSFKVTDFFGLSLLEVDAGTPNDSLEFSFKKANGLYLLTDLNLTDETVHELFEIKEKIEELNKELKSYMSEDSVDDEIVQAVKNSIKIGEEKAQAIIETLSGDAQDIKREKAFDLYHKALSTEW